LTAQINPDALPVDQALENIYTSLMNDNAELNVHISALKTSLQAHGLKEAVFNPERLAQNNRAGRKLMQSYFKKRGVSVVFSA
jgi:spore germination protein YaaH